MKNVAFLLAFFGLWQVALADSPNVASQYEAGFNQDVCQAMSRAADFLVAAQKPSKNTKVGWSWRVDDGPVSRNIAGLAAKALLSAHLVAKDPKYLRTARRYGDGLLVDRTKWSVDNLPYKADVEFLALLADATGEAGYGDAARDAFALIEARSPSGKDEVARIASGRVNTPALLGFDTALGIRAALAVSERSYAYEMADEVIRLVDDWYAPQKDLRFSILSAAALTRALSDLDTGRYSGIIRRFRKDLQSFQKPNGSWLSNETQPSAYAIMALVDGTPSEQAMGLKGVRWLKSTMLKKGSYALYNDYMPEPFVGQVISEVNAEALEALALVCGRN